MSIGTDKEWDMEISLKDNSEFEFEFENISGINLITSQTCIEYKLYK